MDKHGIEKYTLTRQVGERWIIVERYQFRRAAEIDFSYWNRVAQDWNMRLTRDHDGLVIKAVTGTKIC
jgi:hypothetical protein